MSPRVMIERLNMIFCHSSEMVLNQHMPKFLKMFGSFRLLGHKRASILSSITDSSVSRASCE